MEARVRVRLVRLAVLEAPDLEDRVPLVPLVARVQVVDPVVQAGLVVPGVQVAEVVQEVGHGRVVSAERLAVEVVDAVVERMISSPR